MKIRNGCSRSPKKLTPRMASYGSSASAKTAFTDDGIENLLKELIALHTDSPSIIEKRRQALAAMIKPANKEARRDLTVNRTAGRACGLQRMVTPVRGEDETLPPP